MITKRIKGGNDTWVDHTHPSRTHRGTVFLRVRNSGGDEKYAFITPGWRPPRGVTVISATLQLYARGDSTGNRTISATLVDGRWRVARTNWNNQPDVTGTAATVSVGALSDKQLVEIDVTAHLQTIADGARFFGWRITTSGASAHDFFSLNAGGHNPTLVVQYAYPPAKPTGLAPAGVCSIGKPHLRFDYNAFSGNIKLSSVQVHIDPAASSDPAFASEPIPTTVPEVDLATMVPAPHTTTVTRTAGSTTITGGPFYQADVGATIVETAWVITAVASSSSATINTAPATSGTTTQTIQRAAYPGLAAGSSTKWRVQYTTTDGLTSPWSDWANLTNTAKGVLAITAPGAAPNDLVTESTPPIIWTFANQTKFQVIITPAGVPSRILHNSGIQSGADQSYTPPSGVITKQGSRYTVRVRAWDALPRVASPGDPAYVEATRDFTFTYSPDTAAVTALTMETATGFPRARLRFHRATPPDSFMVERDGEVVADNIDPADVLVSGVDYAWEDWAAAPFTEHTWTIIPVVNGKAAQANPSVSGRFRAPGVWVGDPTDGTYFNLIDQDITGLAYGEDADVTPKFAGVVRKITSMRGLEGSISGVLTDSDFDTRPMADQLADVYAIKGHGQRIFRLLVADVNAPVLVGQLSPAPSSDFLDGIEQRAVSLSVWQQGELPFTPTAGA